MNTATTVTATYNYSPKVPCSLVPLRQFRHSPTRALTTVNGVVVVLCQTTLLFPFVTNQSGFDTGIALANTSVDNLAAAGYKSFATAQPASASGPALATTCNLFFYGPFAPTGLPATAPYVADPMGALVAGTTHAFQLSMVAPGYQGYMIAVCPFNYAHAYAFLTNASAKSTGVAEGYIAEVLTAGDRAQTTASGDFGIIF